MKAKISLWNAFVCMAFIILFTTSINAQQRFDTFDGKDPGTDNNSGTKGQVELNRGPVFNNALDESLTPTEGFESATFPPTGWDTTNLTPGVSATQFWTRFTSTTAGNGAYGMSFSSLKFDAFNAPLGVKQYIQTANFPATVAGEVLSFDLHYQPWTAAQIETLWVATSTDGINFSDQLILVGDTNTALYGTNNSLVTATGRGSSAVNDPGWATRRVNMPTGTIAIRFTGYSGFGNNILLDNIGTYVPTAAMTGGTYTINASNPPSATNFQTFRAAADSLNKRGISGAVTFNVAPGLYGQGNRFYLINVAGNNVTNKITFQASGGQVILADTGTSSANDFMVLISGTDWVTFDGINLRDISTVANGQLHRGYYLTTYRATDGPKNVTIKNCHIVLGGALTPPGASIGVVGTNMTGGATYAGIQSGSCDSIKIQSVRVNKSDRGFGFFIPILTTPSQQATVWHRDIEISNCILGDSITIGSATAPNVIGIIPQGVKGLNCFGNRIDSLRNVLVSSTGAVTGIACQLTTGSVYRNVIRNVFSANLTSAVPVLTGIQAGPNNGDNLFVYNNLLYNFNKAYTGVASATFGIIGLAGANFWTGAVPTTVNHFYNNTVILSAPGTVTYSSTCLSTGASGLPVMVRNNVFSNNNSSLAADTTARSVGVLDANALRTLLNSNYNNIFANGTNAYVGTIALTGFPRAVTIADWKTLSTGDTNSVSGAVTHSSLFPLTVDATVAGNWVVNGKGIALSQVTTDINLAARNTLVTQGTTDIGADEVTMSVNPSFATQSAAPSSGGTSIYTEFGDTVCIVNWGTGGTLPTGLNIMNRSGDNPPGSGTAHRLASYLDVVQVGGPLAGTTYNMSMKYGYNELFNIPSIADLRLAKQDGGFWTGYLAPGTGVGQSEVVDAQRMITVRGLTSLSNFTATGVNRPLQTVGLAPNLLLPANNATGVVPNSVTFRWNKSVEGVPKPNTKTTEVTDNSVLSGYLFQLYTDTNSTPLISDSTLGVNDTTKITPVPQLDTLFWRVKAKNQNGFGPFSGWFRFVSTFATGITGNELLPTEFMLYNNYPNPFNPSTTIKFDIPQNAFVSLKVYDITGRVVSVLISDNKIPGRYEAVWNGNAFSSGVYFYRLDAGSYSKVVKMILTK